MNHQLIATRDITTPLTAADLHIASLVAHVRPEQLLAVKAWLVLQPNIEIHAESVQGKFVIVMESTHEKAIVEFLDELRAQPGVLNAALVYHEVIAAHELFVAPEFTQLQESSL